MNLSVPPVFLSCYSVTSLRGSCLLTLQQGWSVIAFNFAPHPLPPPSSEPVKFKLSSNKMAYGRAWKNSRARTSTDCSGALRVSAADEHERCSALERAAKKQRPKRTISLSTFSGGYQRLTCLPTLQKQRIHGPSRRLSSSALAPLSPSNDARRSPRFPSPPYTRSLEMRLPQAALQRRSGKGGSDAEATNTGGSSATQGGDGTTRADAEGVTGGERTVYMTRERTVLRTETLTLSLSGTGGVGGGSAQGEERGR